MFLYFSRNKLLIATIFATIAFVFLHVHLYDPEQQYGSDSQENLAGAYNIAKYNTYAVNTLDGRVHATATREPLFPLMVGLIIKARNLFADKEHNLKNKSGALIYHLQIESIHRINKLTIFNIFLLYVTIFLAAGFVWNRTQNYWFVIYILSTLIFSASLAIGAHGFLTEILASLLITSISILFYLAKDIFHYRKYCILLGLLLSGLVLTKALFLYFLPFSLGYLIILNYQDLKEKTNLKNLYLLIGCLLLIVGGWMLRNFIDFGRFYIADRKAQTLIVRAEYDSLTNKEYPFTYAIWAPGLSKYFLTPETEDNWKRLINIKGNDQIILDAFNKMFSVYLKDKKLNLNGVYDQSDLMQIEKLSINDIVHHKISHVKLTLAFLWRSYFIEDGSGLRYLGLHLPYEANADMRVDNFPLAFIVNLPLWFGFFYLIYIAYREKDLSNIGLVLIPFFTVLAYSTLGFSHPRYMSPLIPVLTIAFCLSLQKIRKRYGNR